MLTQLRIQNFKTWRDTTPLRLAPITVFFGGNSSGKSSIGQFLLMLKRTVEQPDRNMVFYTADDQSMMHLGSYSSYVFDGETDRDVVFEINWKGEGVKQLFDPLNNRRHRWSQMKFQGKIGQFTLSERVVCKEFSYVLPERHLRMMPRTGKSTFVTVPEVCVGLERISGSDKYRLVTEGYKEKRSPGRAWPLPTPSRFYGFPEELYLYFQNVAGFAGLQLELERVLKSICYLGPLRQHPAPSYTWSGQVPSDVGFRGEKTVEALLAGAERKFNVGGRTHYEPLQQVVAQWLVQLGVADNFEVECASKSTHTYRTLLKMPGRKQPVTLPGVGFGVSQVLPVVTQAFYAPPNSTIIIEQPELHLHPAVQSELADLFIEAIRTKEDGTERKVQFLIESHSEHFLRRLQRRVAEQELKPEEVAIYFCESPENGDGSGIRPLEMDKSGRIKNWPKNFFGDQMTDVAEMRKAGLKRELSEARGAKGAKG